MMSSDNDDEKTTGTKIPLFNGDPTQWKYYKRNMESYMTRLGFTDLLTDGIGNAVAKDSDPDPADQAAKKKQEWLKKSNRKATGILLSSISTKNARGVLAWTIVEKTFRMEGFKGGHFYHSWQGLHDRFEAAEEKTLSELQEEYYEIKMKPKEDPQLFIIRLEDKRAELEKKTLPSGNNYKIEEEVFLQDLLGKLGSASK